MDKILEEIRDFADQAHGDQMRKYASERYIVHPVRVMETCEEYTQDLPVLAAALLHDVLEDTETGKDEMRTFLRKHLTDGQAHQTVKLAEDLTAVKAKATNQNPNRNQRKTRKPKGWQQLARMRRRSSMRTLSTTV